MMSMVPWIDEHLPQCKAMFLDLSTVIYFFECTLQLSAKMSISYQVIPAHMVETPVCPDQSFDEAISALNGFLTSHKEAFIRCLSEKFNEEDTLVRNRNNLVLSAVE